jgi:hypothetical protein
VVQLDESWFKSRHESYLANNYLALHNTIVSVTLAVAGLAAGNLIALPDEFGGYGVILVLLWITSLVATLVAFAGAATGAGALPPRVPSVVDLLAPLLLGVSECLMFGVLARQAQSLVTPQAIVHAWYYALGGFGFFAMLGVLRARQIINGTTYEAGVDVTMRSYARGLSGDAAGAFCVFLVGIVGGVWCSAGGIGIYPMGHFILIGVAVVALLGGIRSHAVAQRRFQDAI